MASHDPVSGIAGTTQSQGLYESGPHGPALIAEIDGLIRRYPFIVAPLLSLKGQATAVIDELTVTAGFEAQLLGRNYELEALKAVIKKKDREIEDKRELLDLITDSTDETNRELRNIHNKVADLESNICTKTVLIDRQRVEIANCYEQIHKLNELIIRKHDKITELHLDRAEKGRLLEHKDHIIEAMRKVDNKIEMQVAQLESCFEVLERITKDKTREANEKETLIEGICSEVDQLRKEAREHQNRNNELQEIVATKSFEVMVAIAEKQIDFRELNKVIAEKNTAIEKLQSQNSETILQLAKFQSTGLDLEAQLAANDDELKTYISKLDNAVEARILCENNQAEQATVINTLMREAYEKEMEIADLERQLAGKDTQIQNIADDYDDLREIYDLTEKEREKMEKQDVATIARLSQGSSDKAAEIENLSTKLKDKYEEILKRENTIDDLKQKLASKTEELQANGEAAVQLSQEIRDKEVAMTVFMMHNKIIADLEPQIRKKDADLHRHIEESNAALQSYMNRETILQVHIADLKSEVHYLKGLARGGQGLGTNSTTEEPANTYSQVCSEQRPGIEYTFSDDSVSSEKDQTQNDIAEPIHGQIGSLNIAQEVEAESDGDFKPFESNSSESDFETQQPSIGNISPPPSAVSVQSYDAGSDLGNGFKRTRAQFETDSGDKSDFFTYLGTIPKRLRWGEPSVIPDHLSDREEPSRVETSSRVALQRLDDEGNGIPADDASRYGVDEYVDEELQDTYYQADSDRESYGDLVDDTVFN